jgi:GxxExxY protein
MNKVEILYKEESFNIVGAAMEVHRIIGCGFTEPIYQEALEEEFKLRGIPYQREKTIYVTYKGKVLSRDFRPDFICYDKIIVELKAVDSFVDEHFSQVYNYLKATGLQLGLLINFGKKSLDYKRVPCSNKWKNNS